MLEEKVFVQHTIKGPAHACMHKLDDKRNCKAIRSLAIYILYAFKLRNDKVLYDDN